MTQAYRILLQKFHTNTTGDMDAYVVSPEALWRSGNGRTAQAIQVFDKLLPAERAYYRSDNPSMALTVTMIAARRCAERRSRVPTP